MTWVLAALRDAEITGTVEVNALRSQQIFDHANLEVVMHVIGAPHSMHVLAQGTWRGPAPCQTSVLPHI